VKGEKEGSAGSVWGCREFERRSQRKQEGELEPQSANDRLLRALRERSLKRKKKKKVSKKQKVESLKQQENRDTDYCPHWKQSQ